MHPTIFFDPVFVIGVIAGLFVTAAGVGLLLIAGIWSSIAGEWLKPGESKPPAYRGLCALGIVLFVAGLVWQSVGYYKIGALTFN
jgi:hypothetical protein